MTQDPLDQDENRFVDELCAYQAQLDQGQIHQPDSTVESKLPDEWRLTAEACRQCLDFLHETLCTPDISSPDSEQASKPIRSAVPMQIGRFEILEQLGVGGFGVVFRAHDPMMRRDVAIKIPRPELLGSPEAIERFEYEAAAVAQLEHPNIVPVFDSDCDGVLPYIVMPYIPGKTLARWRAEEREVSPRMAAEIVRQLARGIAHAHARGVLHRDVKPGNVLLAARESTAAGDEPSFVPRLTDFGLAKCTDVDQQITRTGTVIGTICYMSPEQAEGRSEEITARSDVYGLGAVLYELLTGAPPFRGTNHLQTMQNILRDDPPSLRTASLKIPVDLEVICLKCLEKAPANRYPSAGALADDLQKFLASEPISARPNSVVTRCKKWCRRHPVPTTVMGSVALGLISLAGLSLWYNSRLVTQQEITDQRHEITREQELQARRRAYASDMRNAKLAWDLSDLTQTLKLLDRYEPQAGEPDIRDFGWWYLWHEYHDSSRVLGTHKNRATAVAITRNGEIAASGGDDSVIRLWSRTTGELLSELCRHESGVIESLDFSPSGERLVSAGSDGTVRVWDIKTSRELFACHEHQSLVSQAFYSPSGDLIASGGEDNQVRLWNPDTGESMGTLSGHTKRVRCLAFHPTEPILATGSLDGTIRFWNLHDMGPDSRLQDGMISPGPDEWPRVMAFHADGASLIVSTIKGNLVRYRTENPSYGEEFERGTLGVNARCLICSSNGNLILAMGNSEIWVHANSGAGTPHQRLKGHLETVMSVAATSDGAHLVSASLDGTVRDWPQFQVRTQIKAAKDQGSAADGNELQWRENVLAADFQNREVSIYRMPERTLERTFPKANEDEFRLSPPARFLLICNRDGLLHYYRLADGKTMWTQQLPPRDRKTHASIGCDIDSSESYAILACVNELLIVSLQSSEILHRLSHPEILYQVQFLERPGMPLTAITCCQGGHIRFWNVQSGELQKVHQANLGATYSFAISDDLRFLATAGQDMKDRIWRLDELTMVSAIPYKGNPFQIGFLTGGEILVRYSPNLNFWSIPDEAELMTFPEHHSNLAISPDGTHGAIPVTGGIRLIDWTPIKLR